MMGRCRYCGFLLRSAIFKASTAFSARMLSATFHPTTILEYTSVTRKMYMWRPLT